jgi:hypothetical protein
MNSAGSTSASEMSRVEVYESCAHETKSKSCHRFCAIIIFLLKVGLLFCSGTTQSINGCCKYQRIRVYSVHHLMLLALASTKIMVLRRLNHSRIRIFLKAAPKAPSYPRKLPSKSLGVRVLISGCTRLGAPPRLCFEKYVDVSAWLSSST